MGERKGQSPGSGELVKDYAEKLEKEIDRLENKNDQLIDLISHLNGLNFRISIGSFYPFITPEGILAYLNNPKNDWKLLGKEKDYLGTWEDYKNGDHLIRIMVSSYNQEAVNKSFADAFVTIYNCQCAKNNNKNKLNFLLELINGEPI